MLTSWCTGRSGQLQKCTFSLFPAKVGANYAPGPTEPPRMPNFQQMSIFKISCLAFGWGIGGFELGGELSEIGWGGCSWGQPYIWVELGRGRGGVPRWALSFGKGGSSFFLGHSQGIWYTLSELSAQAQSIGTLFEFWVNWVKGGVSGHVHKSEAHALWYRPLGELGQWSSNTIQTFRIMPAWDSQWNYKEMEAMWGCASQLWMPGMCAWASVSQLLPHNSATIQFHVLVSMQVGCRIWKGADWYPCLGWGTRWRSEGGPPRGSTPKNGHAFHTQKNSCSHITYYAYLARWLKFDWASYAACVVHCLWKGATLAISTLADASLGKLLRKVNTKEHTGSP
jgi:hypothetical protein